MASFLVGRRALPHSLPRRGMSLPSGDGPATSPRTKSGVGGCGHNMWASPPLENAGKQELANRQNSNSPCPTSHERHRGGLRELAAVLRVALFQAAARQLPQKQVSGNQFTRGSKPLHLLLTSLAIVCLARFRRVWAAAATSSQYRRPCLRSPAHPSLATKYQNCSNRPTQSWGEFTSACGVTAPADR